MSERFSLQLSLPTFAEVSERIMRSGKLDWLTEDGTILLGDVEVSSSSSVPQNARLAAGIAERVSHDPDPELVYHDEEWTIRRHCRENGVEIETLYFGVHTDAIFIPRQALTILAAELIDCMSHLR